MLPAVNLATTPCPQCGAVAWTVQTVNVDDGPAVLEALCTACGAVGGTPIPGSAPPPPPPPPADPAVAVLAAGAAGDAGWLTRPVPAGADPALYAQIASLTRRLDVLAAALYPPTTTP